MRSKPMTKAHLEAEDWKPSYAECRELSLENVFAWDYGKE